ncbi:MAG: hypothetical protein K2O66_00715, partial [Bacteroidales bacterium]|nr:hypothetical protein [Bacteroidales bacterium]
LMDEPTNGMDIPSKSIFRRLIASTAAADKCIVISTHQVRDLENLIDPIIILEKNRILLNNSVEEITRKLWFGRSPEKSDKDLYREESIGGYNIVGYNDRQEETKMDIEMLFNAAIQNKTLFKRMFIDEQDPSRRSDFADEMQKRLNTDREN